MPKKIEKFKQLLEILNDGVGKNEFQKNFNRILKFLISLKESNQAEFKKLNKRMNEFEDKLKNDNDNRLGSMDKSLSDVIDKLGSALNKKLDDKIILIKDGADGRDADENKVSIIASERALEAITPLIPTTSGIKKELLKMGRILRKALKKKLRISDIKGLKEALDKKVIYTGTSGGAGMGGSIRFYDLSSQLNGVLKTFQLPAFARVVDVKLSSIPVMREDTDYEINGSTFQITFKSGVKASTALDSGQSCWILYAQQ